MEYSIGPGLFIRAKGSFVLNQSLLDQVGERMRLLVNQAIPIQKHSISTDDAVDLFQKNRMYDKSRLFEFRINSHVNIYSLDGFSDYFYGYMVPDTSYLKWFDLQLFQEGFVLLLPARKTPMRWRNSTPLSRSFRPFMMPRLGPRSWAFPTWRR